MALSLLAPRKYLNALIEEIQWRSGSHTWSWLDPKTGEYVQQQTEANLTAENKRINDERLEFFYEKFLAIEEDEMDLPIDSDDKIKNVELFIDIFNRHQMDIRFLQDEAILQRIQSYETALGSLRAQLHSCHSTLDARLSDATTAEREAFTIIARKYKVKASPFDKVSKPKAKTKTREELQAQLAALQAQLLADDED